MSKVKTSFFCQSCGSQYSKWQGQCNACKEWNTIVEEIIQKEEKSNWKPPTAEVKKVAKPLKIAEIDSALEIRMDTFDGELNRVLGGGIVPGYSILGSRGRILTSWPRLEHSFSATIAAAFI